MDTLKIYTQNPNTLHHCYHFGSNHHHLPYELLQLFHDCSPLDCLLSKFDTAARETLLKHSLITVPQIFQGLPVTKAKMHTVAYKVPYILPSHLHLPLLTPFLLFSPHSP